MIASQVWGAAPFDRAIAQTLAFKVKMERTTKTLPHLVQRFEKPARDTAESLEILALAKFWNLVAEHSLHASNCPLLTDIRLYSRATARAIQPGQSSH